MYNSQEIVKRIKLMAKQKNLSINQLLLGCELGKNTVAKMANGTDILTLNFARIADYLNCSVDYLLGRTNDPTWLKPAEDDVTAVETPIHIYRDKPAQPQPVKIMLPLYPQSASAGTGNYLFDATPEWINVPKNDKTIAADFMVKVSGDSMLPKFHDGDTVLIKKSPSILEGEIGVFCVDGESYIKAMGSGELISLNPAYDNIPLSEYNSVYCFGQVIGIL